MPEPVIAATIIGMRRDLTRIRALGDAGQLTPASLRALITRLQRDLDDLSARLGGPASAEAGAVVTRLHPRQPAKPTLAWPGPRGGGDAA